MCIRNSAMAILLCVVAAPLARGQAPLSTEFGFQGRLLAGGVPLNGTADFEFWLFDQAEGGALVAAPSVAYGQVVASGLLAVALDFGAAAFNGEARWLEIRVRAPAGAGAFTTLVPRQPVNATPYALQTRGIQVDGLERVGLGTAPASGWRLNVRADGPGAILAESASGANGATGVEARLTAVTAGFDSAALRGEVLGGGSQGAGVRGGHAGQGYGVRGRTVSGAGVYGEAIDPTTGVGVYGRTSATEGYGVQGFVDATTGFTYGVKGHSASVNGTGVFGHASATSGTPIGVLGQSNSPQGIAVSGEAVATTGFNVGVSGHSRSPSGVGIVGWASSTSGATSGVWGRTPSAAGYGVNGLNYATSGAGVGILGQSSSPDGNGVVGRITSAIASSFAAAGVRGDNLGSGTRGYGVYGTHAGGGTAVIGESNTGVGVQGRTNGGWGVVGFNSSSAGFAGHFNGRVYMAGPVGIGGTMSNPSFRLQLDENSAAKPTSSSWTISSDARLKKNVETIRDALERLLRLRGVRYEWIDPSRQGGMSGTYTGLIAQEVEPVFPEWIDEDADGFKTLTVIGFEGLVVEALRALRAEVNAQLAEKDARIRSLESRLERLEAALSARD